MGLIFVVALMVLAYALVAGRLRHTILTAPMLFVVAGWLTSLSEGFEQLELESLGLLLELTLALVLFSDAARIDLNIIRRQFRVPARLLIIGLPLSIVAGFAIGIPLLGSVGVAALCAVMLAPTDAALGEAVVDDERVPPRIRQSLSVESGLNDGLALPALAGALALATAMEGDGEWLHGAVSIVVGVVSGLLAGWLGYRMLKAATESGWTGPMGARIATLGLGLATFAGAEMLDASGFVAVFVAGATLGWADREMCSAFFAFADNEGRLLTLVSFFAFGAVAVPLAYEALTWKVAVYAVASLTVVRFGAVFIALAGSRMRLVSVAFIAWFGPRGIASVVFALLAVESLGTDSVVGEQALVAVTVTVVLSVIAHGVTAAPLASRYGRYMEALMDEPSGGPPEVQSETLPE